MKYLASAIIVVLGLAAGPAVATPWHTNSTGDPVDGGIVKVRDLRGGGKSRVSPTLDQAVEQVRRKTGGRILSATTHHNGGAIVHRIKVLTPDHRVVIYDIRAGNSR